MFVCVVVVGDVDLLFVGDFCWYVDFYVLLCDCYFVFVVCVVWLLGDLVVVVVLVAQRGLYYLVEVCLLDCLDLVCVVVFGVGYDWCFWFGVVVVVGFVCCGCVVVDFD